VAKYSLEPLERGYGLTVGSALRRVLLSSLPGRAITVVKIDGVLSMDADVPGVQEDVSELLLNLKRVRFRSSTDEVVTLRLEAKGEGEVTAEAIQVSGDIEVVNPDLHIATLTGKTSRLAMELLTDKGKGYVPAETRQGLSLGEFAVDAIFTPVEKVNYHVEQTRLGQSLNYDRLLIEVQTDGSISADKAMRESADILVEHFALLARLGSDAPIEAAAAVPATARGKALPKEAVDLTIDDLDLSTRTYNALRRSNITKVTQLMAMSDDDLMAIRNFGRRSVEEVQEKLRERGLIE